jgi:hypothetical protein
MRSVFALLPMLGILFVGLLAGCNSTGDPFTEWGAKEKYPDFVPPDSVSLARGPGVLTCTIPSKGVLYLLDLTDQVQIKETTAPRLVLCGPVPKGAEISFDPKAKRISAKTGTGTSLSNIDPTHQYELRFAATSS